MPYVYALYAQPSALCVWLICTGNVRACVRVPKTFLTHWQTYARATQRQNAPQTRQHAQASHELVRPYMHALHVCCTYGIDAICIRLIRMPYMYGEYVCRIRVRASHRASVALRSHMPRERERKKERGGGYYLTQPQSIIFASKCIYAHTRIHIHIHICMYVCMYVCGKRDSTVLTLLMASRSKEW